MKTKKIANFFYWTYSINLEVDVSSCCTLLSCSRIDCGSIASWPLTSSSLLYMKSSVLVRLEGGVEKNPKRTRDNTRWGRGWAGAWERRCVGYRHFPSAPGHLQRHSRQLFSKQTDLQWYKLLNVCSHFSEKSFVAKCIIRSYLETWRATQSLKYQPTHKWVINFYRRVAVFHLRQWFPFTSSTYKLEEKKNRHHI